MIFKDVSPSVSISPSGKKKSNKTLHNQCLIDFFSYDSILMQKILKTISNNFILNIRNCQNLKGKVLRQIQAQCKILSEGVLSPW